MALASSISVRIDGFVPLTGIARTAFLGVFAFGCAGLWQLSLARADEIPPAPAEIQAMLETGQVTFEFYDPQTTPRRFPGETKYDYAFRHSFQTEYKVLATGGNTKQVDVTLSKVRVTPTMRHTILLPVGLKGPGLWKTSLVRHELDHVAMSIDPRIEPLLRETLSSVKQALLTLPAQQEVTADWVNQEIEKLLNARGQAVYAVVAYNNRRLDQLTRHGVNAIAERAAFFERLYTKPNLDEAGFAHTGDALELLKSEAYQALMPHYAP